MRSCNIAVKPMLLAHCRCGKDEFNIRGQLFFKPLIQAMRMLIHLGELVPEGTPHVHSIGPGTLFLWVVVVFPLTLATFGIGAATGSPLVFTFRIHLMRQFCH
jgi:hypothetical protein